LRDVFEKGDAWFRTGDLLKRDKLGYFYVQVPGYDGRAGMAAVIAEGQPDMAALKSHIEASLPHYAQPVFLRLSQEAETTSTFKFKKTNLVRRRIS